MANKQSHEFWDLNDGANLKKLELKLLKGLSNASGSNLIENLSFMLSLDLIVKINFIQFSPIFSN